MQYYAVGGNDRALAVALVIINAAVVAGWRTVVIIAAVIPDLGRQRHHDICAVIETGAVRHRRCRHSHRGHGDHYLTLDEQRTQALEAFARQQKITVNTLVQAAWLLMLQRYTGSTCVAFGTTVAGRPAELVGERIGLEGAGAALAALGDGERPGDRPAAGITVIIP